MKKKILYVIALILLCSAGCSNAQEKDHPNKETVKDKVTVTNQTKEDKTTQQEKEETKNEGLYQITGKSSVTVSQMVKYYNKYSSIAYPSAALTKGGAADIETFCKIIKEEADAENMKADVVFIQAMLETGYLKFGGDVKISQFNFAGLGATGNGVAGNSFKDVRTGIRAQVQHLKAYANKEALKNTCVDVRFFYVTRGSAPYVEWLGIQENPNGGGWAASKNYGNDLLGLINKLKAIKKNRQDDVKILSVFLLYLDLIRTHQFSGSRENIPFFVD